MRNVLIIAYYFPPLGLSGVQRIAKLAKYLPENGWHPVVLTAEPGGYFAFDASLLAEVEAAGVEIHRTPSLDPTRWLGRRRPIRMPNEARRRWWARVNHLVFVPDSRVGWYPWAVREGKRLLRARRFDAILSSAPPYTGHLVGASLSRWSGLPLLVDFRDDWLGNPRHVYPTPLHRRLHARLERRVVRASRRVTTINDHICRALSARTGGPGAPPFSVLPQGFDPDDFTREPAPRTPGRMRLLYAGVFYDVQTPDPFLRALALLLERRPMLRDQIEAFFVGLVPEPSVALARSLGLSEVVHLAGYLPHAETVAHLQAADVLWMTVGRRAGAEGISTSKLFEYMGSRKPILALVPEGTVREALAPYGAAVVAPPDDVEAIAGALEGLWERWHAGTLPAAEASYVRQFDRRVLAAKWAGWLDESVIA